MFFRPKPQSPSGRILAIHYLCPKHRLKMKTKKTLIWLRAALLAVGLTAAVAAPVAAQPGADSLFALGRQLVRTNPDSAIIVLRSAYDLAGSDNLLRASICRQMSNAYHYLDSFQMAVSLNLQAIALRQLCPADSANNAEMAILYYNCALNYQVMNDYNKAIGAAEKSIGLFEKAGNDYFLSIVYDLAASFYQKTGSTHNAQNLAFKELALCEKMGDTVGMTYSYDLLAAICESMGQYDQQLSWQKKALELRIKLDDTVGIAQSYNNIGNTYINSAAKYQTDIPSGINTEPKKNLEKTKKANSKTDTALMYLKEALRLKMAFTEQQALRTEFSVSGKPELLKYWRENLVVNTLHNIAMAYNGVDADSCAFYAWKAADYFKLLHDDYGYAACLITICEGGGAKGLRGHTLNELIEEAITISDRNPGVSFVKLKQLAYTKLATINFDAGHYRKAYLYYVESFRLKDSLTSESNVRDMALMESRYEFDKQRSADSIRQYHENLRIEAEHQHELQRQRSKTVAFLCVAIIFAFIFVVLFFYYKTIRENEENKLRRKTLEVERTLLRTQMNPHFIFNAMNSIQSFIISNNTGDAERYLSKFAKLIRMILDNSTRQAVLLCDELQSLRLYLDLEQVRFSGKFGYEIEVDDNVEDDLICVPPMLIQPFVENAILHGLMHKEGGGMIKIHLTDNGNNTLTCTITDNGIGRKAAAAYNSEHRDKSHKSIGMQLTRDRLQDLNSAVSPQFTCQITDLEDEAGNALGTQVTIILPVVETEG